MKKIKANVCAVTHAGRIRKENEDNYDLNGRMTSTGDLKKGSAFVQTMTEPFHLSVCDGMGGESYGELASGIAVETIAAHASNVYESGEDYSFAISNCLDDANSRICAEINARGKRMGTTLAAIYAVKGRIYCVNIGDTRVYHYSKGMLEQISFDHTHAQTIVDAGQVSQDNIGQIPDAKRLTRHLGVFPEEGSLSPNISIIDDVDEGDIILLCSDGLTDMLDDGEITEILSNAENAQTAASKLIRRALEKGGKDNVTVMAASMSVEETAIFTPVAAAVVGDSDADYEDEYRNAFGANQIPDDENYVSPYANADARIYEREANKAKIMKIVGISLGAVALIVIAAFIIKAFVGGAGDKDKTTTTSSPTYGYVYTPPVVTTNLESTIDIWSLSSTETTEEESTTRRPSTSRRPSTTRRPSTSRSPSTTTVRPSTTASTTQTEPSTTENTTESTSQVESSTSSTQTSETQPSESQTQESTQATQEQSQQSNEESSSAA